MGSGTADIKKFRMLLALDDPNKKEKEEVTKLAFELAGAYCDVHGVTEDIVSPPCQSCGKHAKLAVHFGSYAQCEKCHAAKVPLNKPVDDSEEKEAPHHTAKKRSTHPKK